MLAWAKATIAKPIAATINAKPMFCFIGEPLLQPQHKSYAILASKICDGHHKKSRFNPEQNSGRFTPRVSILDTLMFA
jgi:hypothetical protein